MVANQKGGWKMAEIVYPELSYKLVGILFKVYNQPGGGYQDRPSLLQKGHYASSELSETKRPQIRHPGQPQPQQYLL